MIMIFTKCLTVTGQLHSTYVFQDEAERNKFINEDLPKLNEQYGKLDVYLKDLPGLKVGDECHVFGEGNEVFKIEGIKKYSAYRYGFILDSGCSEEVYKCYSVLN